MPIINNKSAYRVIWIDLNDCHFSYFLQIFLFAFLQKYHINDLFIQGQIQNFSRGGGLKSSKNFQIPPTQKKILLIICCNNIGIQLFKQLFAC